MDFVKSEIATLKEQGIVEDAPVDTTWAAPIVVVKKSDGGLRLCTDFRKLNAVTEPDPFPLPRIDDLLHKVGKAKFLTKLDMAKGYHAVKCDDESIPMTGFVVGQPNLEKCSRFFFHRHRLLIAGIHAR